MADDYKNKAKQTKSRFMGITVYHNRNCRDVGVQKSES